MSCAWSDPHVYTRCDGNEPGTPMGTGSVYHLCILGIVYNIIILGANNL